MSESIIFATLNEISIIFDRKFYKCKGSIKLHTKSYKWEESNEVPNGVLHKTISNDLKRLKTT